MSVSSPWSDSYIRYYKGLANVYLKTLPTKPLFSLDWITVSDEQILITIYLIISYLSDYYDDKSMYI